MAKKKAPRRVYTKVKTKFPGKTMIFRGKRYYFYRDAYLRSKDLKDLVARLHKEGYKVRLTGRRGLMSPVVDVYINPEIGYIPHTKILRFG